MRLIIFLLVVAGFIFWRGLGASTTDFNCSYKLIYAVCTPKKADAKLPGLMDIFKAGIKF